MSNNDPDCCGNCRFGKVNLKNVKEVDCHRYPSQVTTQLIQTPAGPAPMYLNATPTMESADWCGEHQRKNRVVN